MILVLDNFDSFTYNLVDYLVQAGVSCHVLRNDQPLSEINQQIYTGIVLSPGPGRPEQAGCMMELIEHYYQKLPILGICLGHQALGIFFGADLDKAIQPMHGKISWIRCKPDLIFEEIPERNQVVRYHSLVLNNLPESLKLLAETDQNEVMAIGHRIWPIRGLQFHPEAVLSTYGLKVIHNWVKHFVA